MDELYHKAVKGMRWGYTKGKRNGGRVAEEVTEALTGVEIYNDNGINYYKNSSGEYGTYKGPTGTITVKKSDRLFNKKTTTPTHESYIYKGIPVIGHKTVIEEGKLARANKKVKNFLAKLENSLPSGKKAQETRNRGYDYVYTITGKKKKMYY